jgi:transposase
METLYECVCGLDVHSRNIQACVRRLVKGKQIEQEIRSFGTMTRDILSLADWLEAESVSHVAMESTGVYWKPIFNILEGRFELLLVNARHVRNVPGRKTDVKDCQWLAQLLQCGLLRASFVPDRPQREFRDLTRHRAQLVAQRAAVANRIHKTLEDANIKLGTVASDILGVSGRRMLQALIAGEQTPEQMADLAQRRMRTKIGQLGLALEGRLTDHHKFMLGQLMDQLEDLDRRIACFCKRIDEINAPFVKTIRKVTELPGFDQRSAENLVAEIGTDMSRFPSAGHLASWAGICPGSNESAGKHKSGKCTKGSRWLRTTLVQAAWAASRTKNSYFRAQFRRLVGRRGKKRAIVAVAHSLLIVVYHVLLTNHAYEDLGVDYFDKLNEDRIVRSHVRRLEKLGYAVALTAAQEAA